MSVARNTNRCACCGQRLCWGRQANVCIRERERRYHGVHSECPEAAARFMARLFGPREVRVRVFCAQESAAEEGAT